MRFGDVVRVRMQHNASGITVYPGDEGTVQSNPTATGVYVNVNFYKGPMGTLQCLKRNLTVITGACCGGDSEIDLKKVKPIDAEADKDALEAAAAEIEKDDLDARKAEIKAVLKEILKLHNEGDEKNKEKDKLIKKYGISADTVKKLVG